MLNFGRVSGGEIRKRLRVELGHVLANLDFHCVVTKFLEAFALIDAGFPGVGDIRAVDDGGIGRVDQRHPEAVFGDQLIALIISIGVRRAGPINLAFEFFLTSVAAELRFFLKKQPILAPEEISGGKTGEASSHDNDIGFAGGARVFERMPVANLVADFEVFTVNERCRWRFPIRRGQKRSVDRSAGGHGTGDDKLDELTA